MANTTLLFCLLGIYEAFPSRRRCVATSKKPCRRSPPSAPLPPVPELSRSRKITQHAFVEAEPWQAPFLSHRGLIHKNIKTREYMTSIKVPIKHGNRVTKWKTFAHSPHFREKSPFRLETRKGTARTNLKKASRHKDTLKHETEIVGKNSHITLFLRKWWQQRFETVGKV